MLCRDVSGILVQIGERAIATDKGAENFAIPIAQRIEPPIVL